MTNRPNKTDSTRVGAGIAIGILCVVGCGIVYLMLTSERVDPSAELGTVTIQDRGQLLTQDEDESVAVEEKLVERVTEEGVKETTVSEEKKLAFVSQYDGESDALLIQTWIDGPEDGSKSSVLQTPVVYQLNPTDEDVAEVVFNGGIQDRRFENQILGVSSRGVWYKQRETKNENASEQVFHYDWETQEAKELFTLDEKHILYGAAVSADGTELVYLDNCISWCVEEGEGALNAVNLYDLDAETTTTLTSQKNVSHGFYSPQYWVDASTVLMTRGFEAEGPEYTDEFYLLNTITGAVKTVALEDNVTSFTISPNGDEVAYTTFDYDENSGTSTSTLMTMSLSDLTTFRVRNSTQEAFLSVEWIDDQTLAVVVQVIESVHRELFDVIEGPRHLEEAAVNGLSNKTIDLSYGPSDIILADSNAIYTLNSYEENVGGDTTWLNDLQRYDRRSGESTTLFTSDFQIILSDPQ